MNEKLQKTLRGGSSFGGNALEHSVFSTILAKNIRLFTWIQPPKRASGPQNRPSPSPPNHHTHLGFQAPLNRSIDQSTHRSINHLTHGSLQPFTDSQTTSPGPAEYAKRLNNMNRKQPHKNSSSPQIIINIVLGGHPLPDSRVSNTA